MIWLSVFLYIRSRWMSDFYINKLDENINKKFLIINSNKHDLILVYKQINCILYLKMFNFIS